MLKKIISAVVATTLIALPLLAQADLVIVNKTNHDSTSIINGGGCSADLLPDGKGITPAGQTNTIPSFGVSVACLGTFPCTGDVYMTNDCSGPVVATVTITEDNTVSDIQPGKDAQGYSVTGLNTNQVLLTGGPAAVASK